MTLTVHGREGESASKAFRPEVVGCAAVQPVKDVQLLGHAVRKGGVSNHVSAPLLGPRLPLLQAHLPMRHLQDIRQLHEGEDARKVAVQDLFDRDLIVDVALKQTKKDLA